MTSIKQRIKNMDKIVLAIFILLTLSVSIKVYSSYKSANSIGATIGNKTGELTGNLVGSFSGYTEGYEKGKEDALKPKYSTELQEKMSGIGKLEVLIINLNYLNVYKSNDSMNPSYAEAYSEDVEVIFTVDLEQMEIRDNNGNLEILLPDVICSTPSPKQGTYKSLAEYKNGNDNKIDTIFKQSEEHKQLIESIQLKINESYYNQACELAIKQVKNIVIAITGKNASVKFIGG